MTTEYEKGFLAGVKKCQEDLRDWLASRMSYRKGFEDGYKKAIDEMNKKHVD